MSAIYLSLTTYYLNNIETTGDYNGLWSFFYIFAHLHLRPEGPV